MNTDELKDRIKPGELIFSTSRSSGPGGQNVNKVNTKVELRFNIISSPGFTTEEKERILVKLKTRINSDGYLVIISQSERSQLMNRKKAEEKLFVLLTQTLTERRKRKPTQATKASKLKRRENKKKRSMIKKLRKESAKFYDES